MRLKSLLPSAFGKFHASGPIMLGNGLNIIMGRNESGKSTLSSFIFGMFYGFKKEGTVTLLRTPEFERFRPWLGWEYKGLITYETDGTTYRVERGFDPDVVRIFDDATGEDITGRFLQDSRKEYNFAHAHLGLTAKEFKNTVWIGQLDSAQDEDLSLAIQGKLENILQGGEEDLPFTRAICALNLEKNKIKKQRAVESGLDGTKRRETELADELEDSKKREGQVRERLITLRKLRLDEADLVSSVQNAQWQVKGIRTALLGRKLALAEDLQGQIDALKNSLATMEWAKCVPPNLKGELQELERRQRHVALGIAEARAEIEGFNSKEGCLADELGQYGAVLAAGLDQEQVAELYSKYLACKAGAAKGDRHVNETRRALRQLEEQARRFDTRFMSAGEDLLSEAEELQSIVVLSEREKSRLDVEVENSRIVLAGTGVARKGGWLYALSLGVLGVAIALTILGLPISVPAFGVSILVFGVGTFQHRKALAQKTQKEQAFHEAVARSEAQLGRVAEARKVFQDFLGNLDAISMDDLRQRVKEVSEFKSQLVNAKDRYSLAHRYWYEATQEFSAVENRLVSLLHETGCLNKGQGVADKAVALLKTRLAKAFEIEKKLGNLVSKKQEREGLLLTLKAAEGQIRQTEGKLLEATGTSSMEGLRGMISSNAKYVEGTATLRHLEEKLSVVLSGQGLSELKAEVEGLHKDSISDGDGHGAEIFEQVREVDLRKAEGLVDQLKARREEIRRRVAAVERESVLMQRTGRSAHSVKEELLEVAELEKELVTDELALDYALGALTELSGNLRREFAPLLAKRASEILGLLTEGHYPDLRVSPELEMKVLNGQDEMLIPVDQLSCGTQDQCYFALRVAVAELIAAKETFPFFFDDSFVMYDDERLEGALRVVSRLSQRHQILLFSCHGREQRIAEKLGIPCNVICLDDLADMLRAGN